MTIKEIIQSVLKLDDLLYMIGFSLETRQQLIEIYLDKMKFKFISYEDLNLYDYKNELNSMIISLENKNYKKLEKYKITSLDELNQLIKKNQSLFYYNDNDILVFDTFIEFLKEDLKISGLSLADYIDDEYEEKSLELNHKNNDEVNIDLIEPTTMKKLNILDIDTQDEILDKKINKSEKKQKTDKPILDNNNDELLKSRDTYEIDNICNMFYKYVVNLFTKLNYNNNKKEEVLEIWYNKYLISIFKELKVDEETVNKIVDLINRLLDKDLEKNKKEIYQEFIDFYKIYINNSNINKILSADALVQYIPEFSLITKEDNEIGNRADLKVGTKVIVNLPELNSGLISGYIVSIIDKKYLSVDYSIYCFQPVDKRFNYNIFVINQMQIVEYII